MEKKTWKVEDSPQIAVMNAGKALRGVLAVLQDASEGCSSCTARQDKAKQDAELVVTEILEMVQNQGKHGHCACGDLGLNMSEMDRIADRVQL